MEASEEAQRAEELNRYLEEKFEDLRKLRKVLEEFAELDKAFSTLKETSTKSKIMPLMVPLSDKGMMSGYIEAPIRVTVAIGENYFIKCDIDKARKILSERRKAVVKGEESLQKEIEGVTGVKRSIRKEPKSFEKFVTQDGFVDIHEEYEDSSSEDGIDRSREPPKPSPTIPPSTSVSIGEFPGIAGTTNKLGGDFPKERLEKFQQAPSTKPISPEPASIVPTSHSKILPNDNVPKPKAPITIPVVKKITPDQRINNDRLEHDVVKFDFESINRAQKQQNSGSSSDDHQQTQAKVSRFRQERQRGNQ